MKTSLIILISMVVLTGCSSSRVKKDFGVEYGWLCTTEKNAKPFRKYDVPNEKENTCIKIKSYKDPVADFYVRDYEKNTLPPMPDLP